MKLLIIEDSKRLRKSLTSGFTRLNFTVDETEDGRQGLNYALTYNYDAVILDIMLPSMNGYCILQTLRDRNIKTNILILSAKDQVIDRVRGLNLGADDYLVKPFSFDELHARIQTLIRRSKDLVSPIVAIGELVININLRAAKVKNNQLSLTPKEYAIFEQLALNQGKVIPYESLGNHICDSQDLANKNTIEVHVSALRKKLKKYSMEGLIKTKRGYGYYINN